MDISKEDLAWLAGLAEGEGSFMCSKVNQPILKIAMTDRDTVYRASHLVGTNVNGPYQSSKREHKEVWELRLTGMRGLFWMAAMFPWMSTRRKEQIYTVWERYFKVKAGKEIMLRGTTQDQTGEAVPEV